MREGEDQTTKESGAHDGSDAPPTAGKKKSPLREELDTARSRAESYLVNWQRAEADFTNYKKKAEQEKGETAQRTLAALILGILPVLDDLERAFTSLPPELGELAWIDGMQLIYRKLQALLEKQGLTEIKAKGEPFDTSLHEAVKYAEGEEGAVLEELQKGYRLSDRILRPTLVVVGQGERNQA